MKLLSENVTLTHRKKDSKIINKSAKSAAEKYKEMTGRSVSYELESGLNDDEAGGIIGSSMGGRIKVDNTLVERLKILEEKVRSPNFMSLHVAIRDMKCQVLVW